jgi:hypothetical protein
MMTLSSLKTYINGTILRMIPHRQLCWNLMQGTWSLAELRENYMFKLIQGAFWTGIDFASTVQKTQLDSAQQAVSAFCNKERARPLPFNFKFRR